MSGLQELFAERRRKCEADQVRKELTEKEEEAAKKTALKAKADARKQAMLLDPKSPKAIQAKHAAEVKRGLEKDKREREIILRRIEEDKIARQEKAEQERAKQRAIQRSKMEAEARADDDDDDSSYDPTNEWADSELVRFQRMEAGIYKTGAKG